MTRIAWILTAVVACVAGCTPAYRVHVSTYSELAQPLDRSAPIYIAPDPNSTNPILYRQIAGKIRDLLQGDGFNPVEAPEKAAYVLTFEVGVDSEKVMDYTPMYQPFGGYRGRHYGLRFGWGFGYTTYMPYIETVYTQWLRMRLCTGADAGQKTDAGEPPDRRTVWQGEALVGTDSPEIRQTVNYLLAACIEYLGVDTRECVTVRIERDDPRIMGLGEQ